MDINTVLAISLERSKRWVGGMDSWSALEWAGAMAGEAGEACNAAKKLKRIEGGVQNINTEPGHELKDAAAAKDKIVREAADTVLYGVLLVARVGCHDFERVIIDVFNKKSEEYGFPERLVNLSPALHASAPKGSLCADCAIDNETCPTCYRVWWQSRHPNTIQLAGDY